MHTRRLGNTGLSVSEIGLGCNRLGESGRPHAHWLDLVRRAVDLGVTVFDTAEAYGWGASESVLGEVLGNRDDVVVATKASGPREGGEADFSAAHLQRTAEASLSRLRRERIDVYQLHSPSREQLERFDWREGMDRLKRKGAIGHAAVAVNNVDDATWLIEQDAVEVLQITYNLFHTQAHEGLFDLAERKGVGLMARLPLARGVLAGKFHPGQEVPDGHRARLDDREKLVRRIALAEELKPLAENYPGGMARLAMHFALMPGAISCLIPGARTVEQLEANVAASNGRGLDERTLAELDRIRALWPREPGWY